MYKIPANTLFFGKMLVFVPECHSTNSLALELAQKKTADGSVVITANQTAGRGQRGNTWHVEPGMNFTFSLVVYPKFLKVRDQFSLHRFVSLGVTDYLNNYFESEVSVKWPNDILVAGKKVCGILIENQVNGEHIAQSVIGIGLNVNQKNFDLPNASSMAKLSGHVFDLQEELGKLLSSLEVRYLSLRTGGATKLEQTYLDRMHWRNEEHEFESNGEKFRGRIVGTNESGLLQISVNDQLRSFDIKQVAYLQ